ncbi:hypothetical protein ACFV28_11135 [Streptomyces sp. NPDC059720]|uniref:hypothetical protein n=1 Tax=Streptomyces sp. NPDC059720 TaxID=3346924 RepID=UPI003698CD3C
MTRRLDHWELRTAISHGSFALFDRDTDTDWPEPRVGVLRVAPGQVHVECPHGVTFVRLCLESWSTEPPARSDEWSGIQETEIALAHAELSLRLVDGGSLDTDLMLPSSGRYRMRLLWVVSPESSCWSRDRELPPGPLPVPSGHADALADVDAFYLAQFWRTSRTL